MRMHIFYSAFKPNNAGWGYSKSYSEHFSNIFGNKESAEVHNSPGEESASLSETSDLPKEFKDAVAALAPLKEAAPELYTQAVDKLRAHYESSSWKTCFFNQLISLSQWP